MDLHLAAFRMPKFLFGVNRKTESFSGFPLYNATSVNILFKNLTMVSWETFSFH